VGLILTTRQSGNETEETTVFLHELLADLRGGVGDRLGEKEDQFFATVFLESGLMFLGMIFDAASAMRGLRRPS
jgi:hypothetical protein